MTLPLGIPLDPNWRDLWWVFHIFKKILYGRNALRKRFYHTISPTLSQHQSSREKHAGFVPARPAFVVNNMW